MLRHDEYDSYHTMALIRLLYATMLMASYVTLVVTQLFATRHGVVAVTSRHALLYRVTKINEYAITSGEERCHIVLSRENAWPLVIEDAWRRRTYISVAYAVKGYQPLIALLLLRDGDRRNIIRHCWRHIGIIQACYQLLMASICRHNSHVCCYRTLAVMLPAGDDDC